MSFVHELRDQRGETMIRCKQNGHKLDSELAKKWAVRVLDSEKFRHGMSCPICLTNGLKTSKDYDIHQEREN
jgi:hypothetical protein